MAERCAVVGCGQTHHKKRRDDVSITGLVREAAERALEVAAGGTDGVYLSFDVDSLDAAFAAATCCPTPGGLNSREALELVRGVSGHGLLGVDVVETAPSLEATPATSLMAGRIAIEAMAHHGGAGR
jgi:arginase family enzyme